MKKVASFYFAFLLFVASSQAGLAQLAPLSIDGSGSWMQAITISGNQSDTEVTGVPYSATEESRYSQRQPDGSLEDRSSFTTHIYRDGKGRTEGRARSAPRRRTLMARLNRGWPAFTSRTRWQASSIVWIPKIA